MSQRLEDYGLIGDTHTAALVGRDGSLDWLCVPRFDSSACFAALLGSPDHGRWLLAPRQADRATRRHYREGSPVLVQEWDTPTGRARVTDFMPPRETRPQVFRRAECLQGSVEFETELVVRYEYGSQVPWVTQTGTGVRATAGPDSLVLESPVTLEADELRHRATFVLSEGESHDFRLQWEPSWEDDGADPGFEEALETTLSFWDDWSGRFVERHGEWEELVQCSLVTLKTLTFAPTGGIVAAPTTSLPEQIGGERNWDYRYCWLRDASFTLQALMTAGYREEANEWRHWLDRAIGGSPEDIQIMYGLAGERRLPEWEVDWLAGYENSRPVRVGNAAAGQRQLDVYGELMNALYQAHRRGSQRDENSWSIRRVFLDTLEKIWSEPDEGIWEVRGGRQQFVHSKVMAWVAFDRAIRSVEEFGYEGPVDRWRAVRDEIHRQVCDQGFDREKNSFVQSYGSKALDASLLLMAVVGFLPPEDSRILGTVAAIERELMQGGFVRRYDTGGGNDGLAGSEGVFLACSFWLVDNYALMGRTKDAEALFEKLVGLANDVGLFAEEYDVKRKRQVGNFPQAFTHVALVNAALRLSGKE